MWLEQRRNAVPFTAIPITESAVFSAKKQLGKNFNMLPALFENDTVLWFLDEKYLTEWGIEVIKDIGAGKFSIEGFYDKWDSAAAEFSVLIEEIKKADLRKKSLEELNSMQMRFYEVSIRLYDLGVLVEPLDMGLPKILGEKLKAKITEAKKRHQYFNTLSTPIESSFTNQEESDLLEIIKEIRNIPEAQEQFKKKKTERTKALEKFQHIKKMIKKHAEEYYFISCNYVNFDGVGEEHFTELIAQMISGGIDVEKKIKELGERQTKLRKEKDSIIKEILLDEKGKALLGLIEQFNRVHDERKKFQMIGFHWLGKILEETGKKMKLDFGLLLYLLPQELNAIVSGREKLDKGLLEERKKFCAFKFVENEPMEIYTGKKAREFEKSLLGIVTQVQEELNGMCASSGYAIGKVRVIKNQKDMAEFKQGEILVASMTTPDYVPLMKKAKAIITDEGGITCHAAIVSRELGVPCVVGTRIATKILKTGDTVEVKANHGIVRRI